MQADSRATRLPTLRRVAFQSQHKRRSRLSTATVRLFDLSSKEPKPRCAVKASAREASTADNPEDSVRAICRNLSGWPPPRLSISSPPVRNILPHPDTDPGRVSRSAATAHKGPCRNKRQAIGQSRVRLSSFQTKSDVELIQLETESPCLGQPLQICPRCHHGEACRSIVRI